MAEDQWDVSVLEKGMNKDVVFSCFFLQLETVGNTILNKVEYKERSAF